MALDPALRPNDVDALKRLSAGSESGVERGADLRDLLTRIADHPTRRLTVLLPRNGLPAEPPVHAA